MSYTALYRKFRPQSFDEVKGQEHIVTTLTNQIKAERIGHAYLFCGTRGTGKNDHRQDFCERQSIVKIRWMAVPAGNAPCAGRLRPMPV